MSEKALCVTCGMWKSKDKFLEGDCTCSDCYEEDKSGINYDLNDSGEVIEL